MVSGHYKCPPHIGFPIYNGQSCMPIINILIDIEFIWIGRNSRRVLTKVLVTWWSFGPAPYKLLPVRIFFWWTEFFFNNFIHSMNLLHASRKWTWEKYDIHIKCYYPPIISWSNGGKPVPSFQD